MEWKRVIYHKESLRVRNCSKLFINDDHHVCMHSNMCVILHYYYYVRGQNQAHLQTKINYILYDAVTKFLCVSRCEFFLEKFTVSRKIKESSRITLLRHFFFHVIFFSGWT